MNQSKFGIAATIFFALSATCALAESYPNLVEEGYKTGALTRGPSGSAGWKVIKGDSKYFCSLRATKAYVGSTGMVAFTSSGRQVKMDRKAYESIAGGLDASIPQLSALKAGRPNDNDIGACAPLKK